MFSKAFAQVKRTFMRAFGGTRRHSPPEQKYKLPAPRNFQKPKGKSALRRFRSRTNYPRYPRGVPENPVQKLRHAVICARRFHRWMKHHDPRVQKMPSHIDAKVTVIREMDSELRGLDLPDLGLPVENGTALSAIILHAQLTGSVTTRL